MKKHLLYLSFAFLGIASCQEQSMDRPSSDDLAVVSPTEGARPGVMRIKVDDSMRERIESITAQDGTISLIKAKSSEALFSDLNISSIKRVFPKDPRYPKRERRTGIDRWYEITFSEDHAMTKAAVTASDYDGVEVVDFIYDIRPAEYTSPFDDPQSNNQWHYQNNSNLLYSKSGSDINLYAAIAEYGITGDPNVIVAVIDGGIDVTHEDIRQNLWVNEAELNGRGGSDDDGNGYVDDVYGYNFMYGGDLTAHDHGTHVAGTVAAVNNNGKGVVGVAGGDGTPESGVRMMSCQIFDHRNDELSGDSAPAFVYAANNGAVIAQCSFGFVKENGDYLPPATQDAIDYFIDNAGTDDDGNQIGPMKGGVVIFAAGNDNVTKASPASYERVIAVAAIGADFEKAYYSNYGSWVDITAPGGDAYKNKMILSTLPGNKYGTMQGTSMACPHVSGIAGLVVSALGGNGFTNEALTEILLTACNSEPLYENNPSYTGKLGMGLIDAAKALSFTNTVPPSVPETVEFSDKSESNRMSFNISIPYDEETSTYYIFAYYSKEDFSSADVENIPENVSYQMFPISEMEQLDGTSKDIRSLEVIVPEFETKYYFRFAAANIAKVKSPLTATVEAVSGINNPPVLEISPEDENFSIKTHEERLVKIPISDPDGHSYSVEITGPDLVYTQLDDGITIRVRGTSLKIGKYTSTITATDEYGASSSVVMNFEVIENDPPVILKEYEGLCISGLKQKVRVNMNEYISDPDKETLTYTITATPSDIVQISETVGYLDITSLSYGMASVYLKATDSSDKYVELNFNILVRPGDTFVDLYPNPVVKELNVRTDKAGDYQLKVVSAAGALVYDGTVTSSPFEPFVLDMENNAKGVYHVEVRSQDGNEFKSTIIKK